MKKIKFFIKIFCVCLSLILGGSLLACNKTPAPKTAEELFNDAKSAVAQITVQSNYGTAFAIKKTSNALYVVTNHHTFPSNAGVTFTDPFSITFYGGETASSEKGDAKLIGYNSYHDIALIRIDKSSDAYAVEPLKTATTLSEIDATLICIGNANNLGLELFTGALQLHSYSLDVNSNGYLKTVDVMKISVPVLMGSSGSPIINYKGEVVGIGSYRLESSNPDIPDSYYCIPISRANVYVDLIFSNNGDGESKPSEQN